MSKLYEQISSTDYSSKNYNLVSFIQNLPHRAQDHIDAQGLILQKYHSDLEALIGSDSFIVDSGTGLTINSGYFFDGNIVIEGMLFSFSNFTITMSDDSAVTYPLSSNGAFYLKLTVNTVTYLDDSTIALKDPVTPTYIQSSTRMALVPTIVFSTDTGLTDVTSDGVVTTYYRKIATYSEASYVGNGGTLTTVPLSELSNFYNLAGLYNQYDDRLNTLFSTEQLNSKNVLSRTSENFAEYPQVTGLVCMNYLDQAGVSEGTFAKPFKVKTGFNMIQFKWNDMTQQKIYLTQDIAVNDTTMYVNDASLLPVNGASMVFLQRDENYNLTSTDPFSYTGISGNTLTGVDALAVPHYAGEEILTAATGIYASADGTDRIINSDYWKSVYKYLIYILIADNDGTIADNPLPSTFPSEANTYTFVNPTPLIVPVLDTRGFETASTAYWADETYDSFTYNVLSTTVDGDYDGGAVLTVADTTDFPDSGSLYAADRVLFTYTSKTGTTFEGVSGGSALLNNTTIYSKHKIVITADQSASHDETIAITLDPMGIWYKIAETQDTFFEYEVPKAKQLSFWVGAKIRDIEGSILENIPTISYSQY